MEEPDNPAYRGHVRQDDDVLTGSWEPGAEWSKSNSL
jgi:hypothetical protein